MNDYAPLTKEHIGRLVRRIVDLYKFSDGCLDLSGLDLDEFVADLIDEIDEFYTAYHPRKSKRQTIKDKQE